MHFCSKLYLAILCILFVLLLLFLLCTGQLVDFPVPFCPVSMVFPLLVETLVFSIFEGNDIFVAFLVAPAEMVS